MKNSQTNARSTSVPLVRDRWLPVRRFGSNGRINRGSRRPIRMLVIREPWVGPLGSCAEFHELVRVMGKACECEPSRLDLLRGPVGVLVLRGVAGRIIGCLGLWPLNGTAVAEDARCRGDQACSARATAVVFAPVIVPGYEKTAALEFLLHEGIRRWFSEPRGFPRSLIVHTCSAAAAAALRSLGFRISGSNAGLYRLDVAGPQDAKRLLNDLARRAARWLYPDLGRTRPSLPTQSTDNRVVVVRPSA